MRVGRASGFRSPGQLVEVNNCYLDHLTAKLALLMESPVLLGVPDGPITDAADLKNPRMSRLGGEPVRDDFLTPLDAVCGWLTPHRTMGQTTTNWQVWLSGAAVPPDWTCCGVCGGRLHQLVQRRRCSMAHNRDGTPS